VYIAQVLASIVIISLCAGFPGLYATLVYVACSQLEKLKAALLDIRQSQVTSEQDCGAENGQQEGQGQGHNSEDMFRHMQKELNNCVSLHQDIQRYDLNQKVFHGG